MFTLNKITFLYSHSHKYTTIALNKNQPLSYVKCKILAFINKIVEDFSSPGCNS
jgi:hypothetical protein